MQGAKMDIESRVATGDVSMFVVESQTSPNDRRSLLRLQNLVATGWPGYAYLEVGSHVGGSIFPHLVDRRCGRIVSIDPRPAAQPDERGVLFPYNDNSAERMLRILERAAGAGSTAKLEVFTTTTASVRPTEAGPGVRLALIDAEHTNRAAFADFASVLRLVEEEAVIAFHDANILIDALWNITTFLRFINRRHAAFFLPDTVCAVALGRMVEPATRSLQGVCFDPEAFYQKSKAWLRTVQRDLASRTA